ncbi:SNF1 protein kinase subunit beta-3 [Yarrowia sp. C11]|nr:SNF1 protein kinase subunit beta-3 [Yarrowia sp. E02]KAG5371883.1 SNF1 protein kinase subunit beta-3 [Yarrowia sp. C11]
MGNAQSQEEAAANNGGAARQHLPQDNNNNNGHHDIQNVANPQPIPQDSAENTHSHVSHSPEQMSASSHVSAAPFNNPFEPASYHKESAAPEAMTAPAAVPKPQRPKMRRKSTLLLDEDEPVGDNDDDMPFDKLNISHPTSNEPKPLSRVDSGEEIELTSPQVTEGKIPLVIKWTQGGSKVYVTGTFTGWRKMVALTPDPNKKGVFATTLHLPPGTHRLRFVVDNELRCSDYLPTATDSMGNLLNYVEVGLSDDEERADQKDLHPISRAGIIPSNDDLGGGYERFTEEDLPKEEYEFTPEIPALFTDTEVMEQYISKELPTPPQLPPHLDSVILNTNSTEKEDNSVLPIPNHVILNHLATTSIKHNVLAVASVSRYSRKYVTQVLYAPLPLQA